MNAVLELSVTGIPRAQTLWEALPALVIMASLGMERIVKVCQFCCNDKFCNFFLLFTILLILIQNSACK